VEVREDGTVILRGTVRAWAEREEAERVACAEPASPESTTVSRSSWTEWWARARLPRHPDHT